MTIVNRYRLRCSTDNKFVYEWAETVPTTCHEDRINHTVSGIAVIIQTVKTDDVQVVIVAGGPTIVTDGISISMIEDKWSRAELTLVEDLHLQGVHLQWINAKVGDYGWLALINPDGESSPQGNMSVDDTVLNVATGKGIYYASAKHVEFWDGNDLVEIALIDSVSGDAVTLKSGVKIAHQTTVVTRVCLDHHTSMRGDKLIDGGLCFIGSGKDNIQSENQMTDPILAGLILAGRFKTSSTAGTREFAVNFKMRRPQ